VCVCVWCVCVCVGVCVCVCVCECVCVCALDTYQVCVVKTMLHKTVEGKGYCLQNI